MFAANVTSCGSDELLMCFSMDAALQGLGFILDGQQLRGRVKGYLLLHTAPFQPPICSIVGVVTIQQLDLV